MELGTRNEIFQIQFSQINFSINYFDEAGAEPAPDVTNPEKTKTYIVATYTNKKIKFDGVALYTDEFPSKLRTMSRSLIMEKSVSSQPDKTEHNPFETTDINCQSMASDVFYETRSVLSTIEPELAGETVTTSRNSTSTSELSPDDKINQPDPILLAKITGQQELSMKIKHTDEVEGPKIEIRVLLGSLVAFVSPRQLHTITELIDALNQPHLEDTRQVSFLFQN